ncbi:MAG: sialate O-acetylesterase [Planctomycetes bacterium]|nr:sialate O-acetylesterase [Planctomycetota bacterium]
MKDTALMKSTLLLIAALLLAGLSRLWAAEVRLSGIFCDHAVLQQDVPVPVWGWSAPGDTVTVEFAQQTKTATADAAGKWQVKLDPMPANAEPRHLIVKSKVTSVGLEVTDLVVGEVWLASGQSNMHWTFAREHGIEHNEEELNAARDPLVRQFTVLKRSSPGPFPSPNGQWHACTRETLLKDGLWGDSALAYLYARQLRQKLGVPVGVINASMGGVAIECWTSEEIQRKTPELRSLLESWDARQAAFEPVRTQQEAAYQAQLGTWREAVEKARAAGATLPAPPPKPQDPRLDGKRPGNYFNAMIAPLIPYAIRGAIWYQGESNARSAETGLLYRKQLPLLIGDWRARWGYGFPFAWVQLPNYSGGGVSQEGWVLVREAMLKSLAVPKTGMAVAIDIGESKNIHPKNKQDVARRLALWSLGEVYGHKVGATSGPLPSRHKVRGNEIVVAFTDIAGGLAAKEGPLKGFEIAGADRQWKPAAARIEADKVIVSHPELKRPLAVRYAWAADPACNLFNDAGLPASPFRTDDWPVSATRK